MWFRERGQWCVIDAKCVVHKTWRVFFFGWDNCASLYCISLYIYIFVLFKDFLFVILENNNFCIQYINRLVLTWCRINFLSSFTKNINTFIAHNKILFQFTTLILVWPHTVKHVMHYGEVFSKRKHAFLQRSTDSV